MSVIEPVIVVTEEASMATLVAVSRVFRAEAVMVISLRVTAALSNPVIPLDA